MNYLADYLSPQWMAFIIDQLSLWLMVFSVDTVRYLLGAGLVSLVLFIGLSRWSNSRRIQTRRASAQDIRREITHSLITTAVYASVALFTIAAEQQGALRVYASIDDYSAIYTLLSLPLLLILHDTYFYWVHRAMHQRSLFRWVHRTHHLSRTPTPWAAYSFAPLEALAMALFMPLALALIPLHELVIFLFLMIMIVRNAIGHSGVEVFHNQWVDTPLDVMTTVTHHDMHHQHFNGNYGLYFTWWDRWMGTELPRYRDEFRRVVLLNKGAQTQQAFAANTQRAEEG